MMRDTVLPINGISGYPSFLRFVGWLNTPRKNQVCKPVLDQATLLPSDKALAEWESIPGTQCITRWADELRNALATNCDAKHWRLVGTGAVIAHEDIDVCKTIWHGVAKHAGLRFHVIPKNEVANKFLESTSLVRANEAAMIYLEPGDWMSKTVAGNSESIENFQNSLSTFMEGFNPGHPAIVVTAVKDFRDMADVLRAPGLFDRRFQIRQPTPSESGQAFLNQLGLDICSPSLSDFPHKLGIVIGDYPDNRIRDLHVLHLQRLSAREKRKLEMIDVIAVGVEGSIEKDSLPIENQVPIHSVAVHEAGHAVIAIIDSAGLNTPDFLSIRKSIDCNGLSVDAYLYSYPRRLQMTYRDFRHQIRSYLAGRAAEEVVFGPENISGSCRADLISANEFAVKAFCCVGFAPHMDREDNSGSNLTVADEDPGQEDVGHVGPMIREFLADQYREVVAMLKSNRCFLDAVTESLLEYKAMDQAMLTELTHKYLHPSNNVALPDAPSSLP